LEIDTQFIRLHFDLTKSFAFHSFGLRRSLPSEFEGVWLFAGGSSTLCKPSDWQAHDNDGLILVTARKIQEWESECNVLDTKMANAAEPPYTAKLNLIG
jgi:hypothetical protein